MALFRDQHLESHLDLPMVMLLGTDEGIILG